MVSPHRSPRRRPPPPLPSSALFGLEKVVLPVVSREHLPSRSNGSTPYSSTSDFNKPLPQSPQRSSNSSVYSGNSGYTHIIQSYADRDGEEQPIPTIIQPKAYRDTIAALLGKSEDADEEPESPSTMFPSLRQSRSISSLYLTGDRPPLLSAYDSKQAPSFSESLRDMQRRRMNSVSLLSSISPHGAFRVSDGGFPLPSHLENHDYRQCYEQHHQYLPGPIAGTITDIVDSGIMPQPLDLSRATPLIEQYDTSPRKRGEQRGALTHLIDIKEAQQRRLDEKERDLEERLRQLMEAKRRSQAPYLIDIKEAQRRALELKGSAEPLPDISPHRWSYKSNSFIISTGFRESIKAIVKDAIRKKDDHKMTKKCVRVTFIPEENYPTRELEAAQEDRKYSWVSSRKSSFQDGVNSVFRNLSISGSLKERQGRTDHNTDEDLERGRPLERGRRQKQLAVPLSPYQKYGAEVWSPKNKKKNAKVKSIRRTNTKILKPKQKPETTRRTHHVRKMSVEVAEKFQIGRSQLKGVLSRPTHMLHRTVAREQKEYLRQSLEAVRPRRLEYTERAADWV